MVMVDISISGSEIYVYIDYSINILSCCSLAEYNGDENTMSR